MGPRAAAGRVALSAGVRRLGGVGVTPVTRKRVIAVAGLLAFVALLGWQHQRAGGRRIDVDIATVRSEEHTSELQSLMRSSYAVFCLKKKQHSTLDYTTQSSQDHESISK